MSYRYEDLKPELLTDDGQRLLFFIHGNVQQHLRESGAVRAAEAWRGVTGDRWLMLACLDRLIELGEIRECDNPVSTFAQHRIFVSARS